MSFLNDISHIPIFFIAAFLSLLFFFVGVIIFYIRNAFVKEGTFDTSNELIVRLSRVIFPLFAFLLASVAVMIVSKRNEIESSLQREVDSAVDIAFLGVFLPTPLQEKINHNLKDYLLFLKNVEWHSLSKGTHMNEGRTYITQTFEELSEYFETNSHKEYASHNLIQSVQNLSDARRDRSALSSKKVHPYMWFILFTDGIISLFIVIFFLKKTINGQFFCIALISISFGLIFSLLIGFNNPFSGSLSISSKPIDEGLNVIEIFLNKTKSFSPEAVSSMNKKNEVKT